MSSEEANTEDRVDSLSEVSSLDDDFARMHFESASSDEAVIDDEVDSNGWSEIESESDGEFLEDHEIVEQVTPTSKDGTINPIDFYRHFITDEVISLMVRETNRYAEQYLLTHKLSKRSKNIQKGTSYQRRNAEIFGDSHRDEFSANAKSKLLL
jgi:hypothetical protein